MPVHVRQLLVIMAIALVTLWLARPMACAQAIDPQDYKRRAYTWIALTVLAFLTFNYWVFVMLSVPLLFIVGSREPRPLGLYLFVMVAVPGFPVEIPAPGSLRYLVAVDHLRWLSLAVLLPAWLRLRKQPGTLPFGRHAVDKFLLAYVVLRVALNGELATGTHLVRMALTMTLDLIVPYYVASRSLRDLSSFRDALMSLFVAVLVMVPMAVFEVGRRWLLYNGLEGPLGVPAWGMGNYLMRGEALLRASVSTGHPIALGYMMAVVLATGVYVRRFMPGKYGPAALGSIAVGLVAAMSRGPWVGAAAALALLVFTGPHIGSKVGKAFALALVVVPLALMTEQGQKAIDYLPFIGTVEARNVEFRQRLFEVALGVIGQNPFFGSLGPADDMEQLRGSDGIIDVVNTYLLVALQSGVVGLTFFCAPFLLTGAGVARALHTMRDKASEVHYLGRALLAALAAIVITIATVSSIASVPALYIVIIGMSVGYLRLVARGTTATAQARAMPVAAAGAIKRGRRQPVEHVPRGS